VTTVRRHLRRWDGVLFPHPRLVPYLVGIGTTAAAVAIRLALDPMLGDRARFLLPLAAIGVVAMLVGPGPAVVSMFAAFVLVLGLLTPSPLSLPDGINTGAFLIVATTLIVLSERLRESLAAAARSTTEARASSASAEQRAAELDAVLHVFPDAVVLFGHDGRQRLANPAAAALIGQLEREEVLARLRLASSPLDRRVETRDSASGCWLEVSSHQVEGNGDTGEVLVMRDVTVARERRRREEALGAMLSHELRTPLTVISGNARVIRRHGDALDGGVTAELLAGIDAESDRMRRLVDDLLVLARNPMPHDTPLEPLILRRIVELVVREEIARRPEADLVIDIPAELPLVAGDAGHLEHVLRSLLGNAAKHAPGRPIRISSSSCDARVTLHVTDRGRGIEPGEEERIFELFHRSPGADATPGSGIGLYVSRALAEAMGGRLHARRHHEGGAEFLLDLPAYDEEPDAALEDLSA
jgi:K+-sensing histidine kinase KdpD